LHEMPKVKNWTVFSGKLINYHLMKTWGNGGMASYILNLGSRWKWEVSFWLWLLCPWDRRLHGPQSGFGHGGKEKWPFPCWELNPDLPVHIQSLYWLSYPSSFLFRKMYCRCWDENTSYLSILQVMTPV
jgi:hypothetical protein